MKHINGALAVALMVVTFIIGLAGGYYVSPQYQQTMYQKEEMGLGKADKSVDLRYINQMISHHRAAILLADQVATKSHKEEVRSLAKEIQQNEPKLIAELYQWKKDWYKDSKAVKDSEVVQLGEVDDTFDLRFLNALIAHHEAGILMTQEIRTKTSRAQVVDNADAVEAFLSNSLETLKGWRINWYNTK